MSYLQMSKINPIEHEMMTRSLTAHEETDKKSLILDIGVKWCQTTVTTANFSERRWCKLIDEI